MSINKKIIITVAAGMVLGVSSCRKFLDVNQNPNVSQTATVKTLLPAAQLYVGTGLGNDLEIVGSIWAGYWTQNPNSSQYRALEQYSPNQDAFSNTWENLYQANENFYQLYKLADSQKKKHYKAIALMMEAYTYQLIADGWNDAPYSQALRGLPVDGGIINPKYDSQRAIYNGIFSMIDSAETILAVADPVGPTTDDLIFSGDPVKWQKFGYTLKLRALLRLSEKDPLSAKAGITALYSTPGVAFLAAGEEARISGYGNTTTNKNPLYAEASSTVIGSTQNLVASSTCVDSMVANSDDRQDIFYTYLSSGAVVGIPQGAYNITVAGGSYSYPSKYVGGEAQNSASATAPVVFMSSAESYFLQAEVEARGWAASGTSDSVLWADGVAASFNAYTTQISGEFGYDGTTSYNNYMSAGGFWTMYPTTGTLNEKLRFIGTQKWFAMCGNQGFEAWTEFRRTGYPDFFVPSANSLIGAQLPKRLLYPTSESTRNSLFPGLVPTTTKVWWDLL